jgi:nuclear GTP-binding protein
MKTKYMIQKKMKEHARKTRKAVNRGTKSMKRKKKDIGIPSSWPFKADLLDQIERAKRDFEERKEEAKQQRREERLRRREMAEEEEYEEGEYGEEEEETYESDALAMASMVQDATSRAGAFALQEEEGEEEEGGSSFSSRDQKAHRNLANTSGAFGKEVNKVIASSDVIVEVLDARDPEGTRSLELETAITSRNIKLVFLVNKIDLADEQELEAHVAALREIAPVVLFKANTQSQNKRLGQSFIRADNMKAVKSTRTAVGVDNLMHTLRNYCRTETGQLSSITVGVVGCPNVGKSSVLNSLSRSRVTGVSSTAGSTRSLQTIQLDKHIALLDSPGVVFASSSSSSSSILAVAPQHWDDPTTPLEAIFDPITWCQSYNVQFCEDLREFLGALGRKYGILKKRGLVNIDEVAKKVIHDIQTGDFRISLQSASSEGRGMQSYEEEEEV